MKKKILITGGTGYIGSCLFVFLKKKFNVHIVDKAKKKNNKIELEFRSQSFLKQQVRSMVGCLKYIGEKKWTLKKFISVIKLKNRNLCAPPAPAEGLFLKKVLY